MRVLSGGDLKVGDVMWAETPEGDLDGPTTITWYFVMEGYYDPVMETPGWISHGCLYAPLDYELVDDVYDAQGLPRPDVHWYDVATGADATVEGGEMRDPMGTRCAMCRQPVWLSGGPRYVVSETVLEPRPDGTYQWTSAVPTGIVAASVEEAAQAYEEYLAEKGLEYRLATDLKRPIHNPGGNRGGPAYWLRDPESSVEVPYMAVIEEVFGYDPEALRT